MIVLVLQAALLLQCDGVTTSVGYQRAERAAIEIDGDAGRIQAPPWLAPGLNGRGDAGGWRALTDLVVTDREIRGRFSYNWINKPLVVINRLTGDIQISGGDIAAGDADFRGDCRAASQTPLF